MKGLALWGDDEDTSMGVESGVDGEDGDPGDGQTGAGDRGISSNDNFGHADGGEDGNHSESNANNE